MIADYLREAYARTGLFGAVVSQASTEARAVLGGRVAALDEVDETSERWVGHIELELSLYDASNGARIWSAIYERRETMKQRSPEGLARALSAALASIVAESAPALAAQSSHLPDAPP